MSCGSLPPVPGLIPISVLRKSPSCSSNNNDPRECTPCAVQKEVMGEQRSRRTGAQPSVDLIDIARRSRAVSATPQAPSGKNERHRKSDRRRGEHRGGRKRSVSKRRETSPLEEEKCVNPRVNPIFVWVRQEDTHIVDVKCEDYDKRNRIVLTKTAQGWRAIPRTETLVPNLKAAAVEEDEETIRHHARKARKSGKVKRKNTGVQVDDVVQEVVEPPEWNVPINIESHLPSHTIQIHRKHAVSMDNVTAITDDACENVNTSSVQGYDAHASAVVECSANKICDVSPLDNLLAVAELEFNQQIQTEAWCESEDLKACDDPDSFAKEFASIESKMEDADTFNELPVIMASDAFDSDEEKDDDDCDYNEDDENNLAMDDILTRLEQSLQSPDVLCTEIIEEAPKEQKQDNFEELPKNIDDLIEFDLKEDTIIVPEPEPLDTVGSTTNITTAITAETNEDSPTDLSTSKKVECLTINLPDEDLLPTDLSLPKNKAISPRPSSRCSETIQSPQPSGLPAVPHSPDVHTPCKPAYLENLLSSTTQKISLNSEVTITKQKEPIDFGKSRKSASPTVTCSEEVTNSTGRDGEPESKKVKLDDAALKKFLHVNDIQSTTNKEAEARNSSKSTKGTHETSRLLELLTTENEPDALTQLKQLSLDPSVNLPDPMLVPKNKLSQILMSPGREIPKLLTLRPELRLPEALAFPHLLQDPDILVITVAQLETIIRKQTLSLSSEKVKQINNSAPPVKKPESEGVHLKDHIKIGKQGGKEHGKQGHSAVGKETGRMSELCNDVNLVGGNNNVLNQMMWLPYLQQLEVAAMAFGNGADFLKMLTTAFPPYSAQVPDVSQMFPLGRFPQPPGFPTPPTNNPFEFPIWPEANSHAALQRTNQYERHCSSNNNNNNNNNNNSSSNSNINGNKNNYREYVEKMSNSKGHHHHHQTSSQKYGSTNKSPSFSHVYHQNNPLHVIQHQQQQPFINVPATYQPPNMRHNLQIPQYNLISSQKNPMYTKSNGKISPSSAGNCDLKSSSNFNHFYGSKNANQRYNSYNQKLGTLANNHKTKATFGTLEAINRNIQEGLKKSEGTQPMDLSGSTTAKTRVGKQNFCTDYGKSLKLDDIPEVGSTTASIEDMTAHMQESQKHLWHPLFGNHKSSTNPWNWTTVSATGE